MPKRTTNRRIVKEDQKIVKQLAREMRQPVDIILDAIDQHADRIKPGQLLALRRLLKKKYHKGVDLGYLKTIIFPEYYKYDIPAPLTNLSYSKFEDKQELTITTGPKGEGMLVWFPRTTEGASVFVYYSSSAAGLPTQAGIGFVKNTDSETSTRAPVAIDNTKWYTGFERYYSQYFTQTSLIAASMSIQYIGQQEQQSGILLGGHLYGQKMNDLVMDDIENAQYLTRASPNQGLRFVYLPMEATDYEYYPTTTTNSHNSGGRPSGNEDMVAWSTTQTSASNLLLGTALDTKYKPATQQHMKDGALVATDSILYAGNTNYCALYWQGLPPNSPWLRLDALRQFNGVPKQAFRDIVQVSRSKKNFNSRKTFDILKSLCINTSIGAHKFSDVERLMDTIVDNLPNVEAVAAGENLEHPYSMDEFATKLQQPMGQQLNIEGMPSVPMERVYQYD